MSTFLFYLICVFVILVNVWFLLWWLNAMICLHRKFFRRVFCENRFVLWLKEQFKRDFDSDESEKNSEGDESADLSKVASTLYV